MKNDLNLSWILNATLHEHYILETIKVKTLNGWVHNQALNPSEVGHEKTNLLGLIQFFGRKFVVFLVKLTNSSFNLSQIKRAPGPFTSPSEEVPRAPHDTPSTLYISRAPVNWKSNQIKNTANCILNTLTKEVSRWLSLKTLSSVPILHPLFINSHWRIENFTLLNCTCSKKITTYYFCTFWCGWPVVRWATAAK